MPTVPISGVVKTALGFEIYKVDAIVPAEVVPLETAQREISREQIARGNVATFAKELGDKVLAKLSDAERGGWAWLVTRETVTTAEYQDAMDVPERTARFHLRSFGDLGLLRAKGAGRARRYEVAAP